MSNTTTQRGQVGPLPRMLFIAVFGSSAVAGVVVQVAVTDFEWHPPSGPTMLKEGLLFALGGIAIALTASPTKREQGLYRVLTLLCLPVPSFEFGKATARLPEAGVLVTGSSLLLLLAPALAFWLWEFYLRASARPTCLVTGCRGYCLPVTVDCLVWCDRGCLRQQAGTERRD